MLAFCSYLHNIESMDGGKVVGKIRDTQVDGRVRDGLGIHDERNQSVYQSLAMF